MAADKTTTYDDQFDWDAATTGGFLTDYVATVSHAEFFINPEYNNGENIQLKLTVDLVSHNDPGSDLEPGDQLTVSLNACKVPSWEIAGGGASISRVDGKKPALNSSTALGRVIAAITAGADYGDADSTALNNGEGLLEVLRSRPKSPLNAETWEGLTFQFQQLNYQATIGGDDVKWSYMLPVDFLGEDTSVVGEGGGSASANNGAGSMPTEEQLVKFAGKHADFNAYLAAVLSEYPGIEASELSGKVMDKDNGIWATAQAG